MIKSDAVQETQDHLPLGGGSPGEEESCKTHDADDNPHKQLIGVLKGLCRQALAFLGLHSCIKPKGGIQVGRCKHCNDQGPEQEQPDLGGHHSQEDLLVAQVAEPEPVRVERPAPVHTDPDDDQDHNQQDPLGDPGQFRKVQIFKLDLGHLVLGGSKTIHVGTSGLLIVLPSGSARTPC